MSIIVDLTDVSEAFGEETSYFGGTARIDKHSMCVDGCTDRGTSPNDKMWEYLGDNYLFLHDTINAEEDFVFDCGKKYELKVEENKIEIEEIEKTTEISIELQGEISKERLNKLISIIDAQLMDGEDTDESKFDAWCDSYKIYVDKESW